MKGISWETCLIIANVYFAGLMVADTTRAEWYCFVLMLLWLGVTMWANLRNG